MLHSQLSRLPLFCCLLPAQSYRPLAKKNYHAEVDEEGIEIWSDDRPSDEPLQGSDVVRRDQEKVAELVAQDDFLKSWIIVVDGVRLPSGGCGVHLEFSEPAENATSKSFYATAFDSSTCATEWVVGIPSHPAAPQDPEFDEAEAADDKSEGDADQQVGYMNPDVAAQLRNDSLYYPLGQIRYTVYAEWQDIVNKPVNRVGAAVKAHVDKNDKQSNQHCKNQRKMLVTTVSHWQDLSTGHWAQADCVKGNKSTKAITSARFKNEDFVVCDQLNDPAWVYYEGVYAKAATNSPRGNFTYGVSNYYQDGCNRILHWAGFHTFEGEYNNIPDV